MVEAHEEPQTKEGQSERARITSTRDLFGEGSKKLRNVKQSINATSIRLKGTEYQPDPKGALEWLASQSTEQSLNKKPKKNDKKKDTPPPSTVTSWHTEDDEKSIKRRKEEEAKRDGWHTFNKIPYKGKRPSINSPEFGKWYKEIQDKNRATRKTINEMKKLLNSLKDYNTIPSVTNFITIISNRSI